MIPALVISGTQSGVGKTSIALGLCRALTRRGVRVQPAKVPGSQPALLDEQPLVERLVEVAGDHSRAADEDRPPLVEKLVSTKISAPTKA